jgi:hypothetical protein
MDKAKKYQNKGKEMGSRIDHIPATIFFKDYQNGSWVKISVNEILINVANNIEEYGYAVIVLHPQDFAWYTDTSEVPRVTPTDSIDYQEISDLLDILYNLQSDNRRIVGFEEILSYK